jgi:hypothetical protein
MLFVFLLILLPVLLPIGATLVHDPAPGLAQTKAEARALECTRMGEIEAHDRYPGVVAAPSPRGSFIETAAVACRERLMEAGDRANRDEVILSELTRTSAEIAEAASAAAADAGNKTWLVEAYYPDAAVAAKLSFAAKTALVEHAKKVSDRVPVLAAGDILVLGRMAPAEAYPLACSRYRAEGSMADDDVLLGVVLRDSRETILHAGLCTGGRWRWLR